MIDAADQGRIEDVKSLLNDESVDINGKEDDPEGWRALHWACNRSHRDVVDYLLDNGADIEARTSNWDETPLSRACSKGISPSSSCC